jgi:heterodisulfide reductase subunit C
VCGEEIKAKKSRLCTECARVQKRRWRQNNPVMAVFVQNRDNAKRRGIRFLLTFEEFVREIVDTGYMQRKGVYKHDLTIDRIRPELGYRAGNLQVIPNWQNVQKYKRGECWTPTKQSKEDSGTPF